MLLALVTNMKLSSSLAVLVVVASARISSGQQFLPLMAAANHNQPRSPRRASNRRLKGSSKGQGNCIYANVSSFATTYTEEEQLDRWGVDPVTLSGTNETVGSSSGYCVPSSGVANCVLVLHILGDILTAGFQLREGFGEVTAIVLAATPGGCFSGNEGETFPLLVEPVTLDRLRLEEQVLIQFTADMSCVGIL